jgi:acetolactate synthase-1/2/3 large subunit
VVKTNGSCILADTIKGYGVTHVFLVPAVVTNALALMDQMGIKVVPAHSELAAAYMADGYARASRRVGVCMAQTVGAANLAAGLRDPFLASSPVIALTGGPHADIRYKGLYQQVEDFSMYEPVTKANYRVEKVERLADMLRQAFRDATTGAPGPVHIEAPGRLAHETWTECDTELIIEPQFGQVPPYRPEPEPEAVQAAVDTLVAAKRPIILAGGGVVVSDAAAELVQLAERLSLPVITSLNGKGVIAETHPLALGVSGSYGRWGTNEALAAADTVFFIGTPAGGHPTDIWTVPRPGTTVVHCDIRPSEVGRNYPAKVGLVGDAKVTLQRMLAVAKTPVKRAEWVARATGLVKEWETSIASHQASNAKPIRPERICQEITAWLPENGILVADTGHSAIWTACMVKFTKPGQRYIRCAGTLGWGFPGAMGAKCAQPDRPVLCVTGDGGFYYHMGELETAARFGINVVVLVNNNGGWNQTWGGIRRAYGGDASQGHNLWAFHQSDFAGVAESMGCLGIRVTEPGQIRPALELSFAAGRPAVIDVRSDPAVIPPPPKR